MTPEAKQLRDKRIAAFLRVFNSSDGAVVRGQLEEMRDARIKRAMDATTDFDCLKETQRAAGVKAVLAVIDDCFTIESERKEKERKEAKEEK